MVILNRKLKRAIARMRSLLPIPKCGARILLYHSIGGKPQDHRLGVRVPEDIFEIELEELTRSGYKMVTVSEIIENIDKMDGDKIAAITFDDGYRDNFTFAAKKLKELNLKATFFICAAYIEQKCRKSWSDGSAREYMRWEEVRELNSLGFEIGSHMTNHRDLTKLGESDIRFELIHSKELISEKVGNKIQVFSYPYGKTNQIIVKIAKEAGYIGGCSSFSGSNYSNTNKFLLRRTEIGGYDQIRDFRHKLRGFYDFMDKPC
ncbi:MAG: polysaccharide deacetylase family protein [Candidatus Omnitrophica bacterium]|nr:polysaccharide deacetylase family protein [Candidatus Omnitrophota bacterium]